MSDRDPLAELDDIDRRRRELDKEWRSAVLRAARQHVPKKTIAAHARVSRAWVYQVINTHEKAEGTHP